MKTDNFERAMWHLGSSLILYCSLAVIYPDGSLKLDPEIA